MSRKPARAAPPTLGGQNIIDKAIAYIAPGLAMRRLQERSQLALSGGYTGARIDRAQLSRWMPTGGSPQTDIIRDFSPHGAEGDLIQFQAGTFTSYAAVQAASQQVGGNVVITFSATDVLTLQNVSLAALSSSDFII